MLNLFVFFITEEACEINYPSRYLCVFKFCQGLQSGAAKELQLIFFSQHIYHAQSWISVGISHNSDDVPWFPRRRGGGEGVGGRLHGKHWFDVAWQCDVTSRLGGFLMAAARWTRLNRKVLIFCALNPCDSTQWTQPIQKTFMENGIK